MARGRRAEVLTSLMEKSNRAVIAAVGQKGVGLYHHIGLHHMPAMIIIHGSLARYCCQNLEHLHSIAKRCNTNKFSSGRNGGASTTCAQIVTQVNIRQQTARTHPETKGTGTKRTRRASAPAGISMAQQMANDEHDKRVDLARAAAAAVRPRRSL